jgi:hypothetical protein
MSHAMDVVLHSEAGRSNQQHFHDHSGGLKPNGDCHQGLYLTL